MRINVNQTLLTEMLSPVVWHFCWFDALSSILRTNTFRLSESHVDRETLPGVTGYSEKHPYYMCVTRSKNSGEGYSKIVSDDNREGYARIQINGDALNSVVHAKASDYFGNRNDGDIAGKRALYKGIEKGYYAGKTVQDIQNRKYGPVQDNEKEDTIWYYKPVIENVNRYIQRVDILIPTEESMKENASLFNMLSRNANRLGIPLHFYTNIKDMDLQTDNTFDVRTLNTSVTLENRNRMKPKRIIRITEGQYRQFVNPFDRQDEGVTYSYNGDGTIDFSVNQDRTDKNNQGALSADTRVFGTKSQILHGDGTRPGNAKSLSDQYNSSNAAIEFLQNVIDFVKGGRKGRLEQVKGLDNRTYTAAMKWLDGNMTDEEVVAQATRRLNDIIGRSNATMSTYQRVANTPTKSEDDKVARYITGTVPSTNVKYIALFQMSDFNFSDAMKHGTIRQNGNTDELLGIDKSQRSKTGRQLDKIPVTYDGGQKPNIAQNFSLDNVPDQHFRQQYGMNGAGGYNSVTQFLDKSINYASYALTNENFIPDFIVAAPSSSKYNDYYCKRLSQKLGKTYVADFFRRNVVNIKFDGNRDTQEMLSQGFTPAEVLDFETKITNEVFNEIGSMISAPMKSLVSKYAEQFSKVKLVNGKRQYADINTIIYLLCEAAYSFVLQNIDKSFNGKNKYKALTTSFNSYLGDNQIDKYNVKNTKNLQSNLWSKFMGLAQREVGPVLEQMMQTTLQYAEQLSTRGYHLDFRNKNFKITNFDKRFRPYLRDVYVIADKECNKNGELFSRYKNGRILIFDEDINSGGTLKCAIDALNQKLNVTNNSNLMCLVNAYSASGK